ncbi:hypothetical protein MTR67_026147 [Solanum verrucosum]|uniref:Uncharacterized protein n=1 Tax=Solanum verrucosum TaxID=315347 RepID=A0AAF0R2E8_SOLVR|nr:hypothetical protein MTR67_026147 [Solanum verrucosum]
MTKSAHFFLVKVSYSVEDYAKLYLNEMTDGQAEHTIHTLEDMLRVCVIHFKGNWDDNLALIEFAYSNSYHSSIGMALFEALFGRRCRYHIAWFEVGEITFLGPKLVMRLWKKIGLLERG